MRRQSDILIAAVGDVFLNRGGAARAFDASAELLAGADLRFANCEGVYTNSRERAPSAGFAVVAPAESVTGLKAARFDVMSLANNHSVDAGHAGLAETLQGLRQQGIRPVGAGGTRSEAREPTVLECCDRRIAFLAFSSVYQPGYEARDRVPGIAAMRAHWTYYYPDWDPYGRLEPGSRPHVRTFAYPEDMRDFRELIGAARERSDAVVVSFHWGDSSRPAFLHDYEFEYGHAAIDAGAHLVLGHHHHFLRAVERYRGKSIFYGLGHFAFDLPGLESALSPAAIEHLQRLGEYAIYPRSGYPRLPFHPDARLTAIAYSELGTEHARAWILPCVINPQNDPIPCGADSPGGRQVWEYMENITRQAGLGTRYVPEDIPRLGVQGLSIQSG